MSFFANTNSISMSDLLDATHKEYQNLSHSGTLSFHRHPFLKNIIIADVPIPVELPHVVNHAVFVDERCAEAVLRGADVFAPGILATSKSGSKGEFVSVFYSSKPITQASFIEVPSQISSSALDGNPRFLGNGKLNMVRSEIFESIMSSKKKKKNDKANEAAASMNEKMLSSNEKEVPSEERCAAITMTQPLYSFFPVNTFLPQLLFPTNIPSAYAVRVLDPRPGERVIDLCSAPGGKSLQIFHQMRKKGVFVCLDRSKKRLEDLKNLFMRHKFNCRNVYSAAADAENLLFRIVEEDGEGKNDHTKRQMLSNKSSSSTKCSSEDLPSSSSSSSSKSSQTSHKTSFNWFFSLPFSKSQLEGPSIPSLFPSSATSADFDSNISLSSSTPSSPSSSSSPSSDSPSSSFSSSSTSISLSPSTTQSQSIPSLPYPPSITLLPESFDRVLADVPCSALGQRPRVSFSLPHSVFSVSSVQTGILRTALALCDVGGCVVYSTCTLNPWENEYVVAKVLREVNGEESEEEEEEEGGGEGKEGEGEKKNDSKNEGVTGVALLEQSKKRKKRVVAVLEDASFEVKVKHRNDKKRPKAAEREEEECEEEEEEEEEVDDDGTMDENKNETQEQLTEKQTNQDSPYGQRTDESGESELNQRIRDEKSKRFIRRSLGTYGLPQPPSGIPQSLLPKSVLKKQSSQLSKHNSTCWLTENELKLVRRFDPSIEKDCVGFFVAKIRKVSSLFSS
ncbi:putative NOL1/NOP2/sun family protein [Monocercomonoides exilis]|uniref:putative NOL1/NOP2/sun family protein n=1 Tax=Monocercomonoides exilis TaxID=2049356 RepID=UPI00355A9E1A|nr:putative NOL1/NOP2/sun family protein [Monocercomonoides exilis]|eukprot:MONOS_4573.1-p1 / transcript=MONOS_4573.1 / gene=MONOS_4573 / organism=Monocercomonoides_exilis_PA203 / gene_product=NOL1 / transcript_product=NOL1 / location=Mono_scaffold00123:6172-9093(+) / protein_length=734 / sequence_SO=supercontig / SO=protein_coding / is_pseudo=false